MSFGEQLDLRPLTTAFVSELRRAGRLDLAALGQYALLETMYLPKHAKPAIDRLVQSTIAEQVENGRSYAEKVFRLTNDGRRRLAKAACSAELATGACQTRCRSFAGALSCDMVRSGDTGATVLVSWHNGGCRRPRA
jgi:hypothetical protein